MNWVVFFDEPKVKVGILDLTWWDWELPSYIPGPGLLSYSLFIVDISLVFGGSLLADLLLISILLLFDAIAVYGLVILFLSPIPPGI